MKKLTLDTPFTIPEQQADQVRVLRTNMRNGALIAIFSVGNQVGEVYTSIKNQRIVINNQTIIDTLLNNATTQEELHDALITRAQLKWPGTVSDIT